MRFIIICLSLFINSVLAGASLKIEGEVISYNDKRIKLKTKTEVVHLYFKDLDHTQISDLENYVGKKKAFYIDPKKIKRLSKK